MKVHHVATAVLLSIGAVAAVQAADVYVGASLGASSWKIDEDPTVQVDKNDTGYKLFFGVAFAPAIALEGGYVDLGKAKFSGSLNGNTVAGDLSGSGVFLDLVGRAALTSDWSVFGKIGAFNGKAKGTVTGIGSASDSGTDITYGVGVNYAISKQVSVRGEWERFRFKVFGDKGDVDLLSVGVTYSF